MRNISQEIRQILGERLVTKMKRTLMILSVAALATLLHTPLVSAASILGSDLASFTVLGAVTVTNVPTSTIVGNVGVSPGSSITGFDSSPGVAEADLQVTGGLVHTTTDLAASAQSQLTTAITNLGLLGPGTTLSASDLTLAGTLFPGVYTVPTGGATNLSGTLTLDGLGNANAAWVFQFASTLITSPNSVVNVINTGSGAGLYWNVGSSATIDVNTTFMGNILALTDISMNTTATNLCGRALADNGAVTLIQNSLSGVCSGILAGSDGLSGGLDVTDTGEFVVLPFVPVPEPSTVFLLASGLVGLVAFRKWPKKA